MPSHVHDQHVLGFEWFLLPTAFHPVTDKTLLVTTDVVLVDVLREKKLNIYQRS